MVLWYKVFRNAAYINALVSAIWTILLIIPSPPFSYLLVIVERGGPGTWFLVAYFLYLIAGSVGFATISSMLYVMEVYEGRSINRIAMYLGFSFYYVGVLLSSVMLGVAGEIGGYGMYLADYPEIKVASVLSSFIYPITFTAFLAVIGIIMIIIALMSSRAQQG